MFLFRGELQVNGLPETLPGWDLCSTWWGIDGTSESWGTRLPHLPQGGWMTCLRHLVITEYRRALNSCWITVPTAAKWRGRPFRKWSACESSDFGMESLLSRNEHVGDCLARLSGLEGNDTYWLSMFFNQSLIRKAKAPGLSRQQQEERSTGPVAAPELWEPQNCLRWDFTSPYFLHLLKCSLWLA